MEEQIRALIEAPKIVDPRKVSDDKIMDDDFLSKIDSFIKKRERKKYFHEIEISLGTFSKDRFTPGLNSAFEFSQIKSSLKKHKFDMKYSSYTVRIYSGYRKIFDKNKNVTFQKKERLYNTSVSNFLWGYRITESYEKKITQPENIGKFLAERIIQRYTYTSDKYRGLSIDLSVVNEYRENYPPIIKYELEIENSLPANRVEAKTYKSLLELIYQIRNSPSIKIPKKIYYVNSPLRNKILMSHNLLFGVETREHGGLFTSFINKPINIKLDDFVNDKISWAITKKLDGYRKFLYITSFGSFLLGYPYEIIKIGEGSSTIKNTLIDGEFLEGTFYAFDVVFSSNKSYQNIKFSDRYSALLMLKEYLTSENLGWNINYQTKEFFYTKDVYTNISLAIESIKEDEPVDGLIFQYQGYYKNKYSRKWKPLEQMTIDFYFLPTDDPDTFVLQCFDKDQFIKNRKYVSFVEKTPKKIIEYLSIVKDGMFMKEYVGGRIIECLWDGTRFYPYRFRDDRDHPNALIVAKNNFKDIKNPISIESIQGLDASIMRRYHNNVKRDLLNDYFGDCRGVLIDSGTGRGGDFLKWKNMKFSNIISIEPSSENIKEMKSRLIKIKEIVDIKEVSKQNENLLDVQFLNTTLEDYDTISKIVYKNLNDRKICGLTSFFSLQFIAKSKENFDNALKTLDIVMPKDSIFLCIVMDSEKVNSLLDENGVYECDTFKIERKKYNSKKLFGNKIITTLKDESSMVKDVEEYLFPIDHFITSMIDLGYEPIQKGIISDFLVNDRLPLQSQIFSSLFKVISLKRVKSSVFVPKLKLEPDIIQKFYNRFGIELYDIGIIQGPSNIIHAVLRAVDKTYLGLSREERIERVNLFRKALAKTLTIEQFRKINQGKLFKKFISLPQSNSNPYQAFEIYKNILLDVNEWLGEEFIIDVLIETLNIDIRVLDKDYNDESIYSRECRHLFCVILHTKDHKQFQLLGEEIKNGKNIKTKFSKNDKIVKKIC